MKIYDAFMIFFKILKGALGRFYDLFYFFNLSLCPKN